MFRHPHCRALLPFTLTLTLPFLTVSVPAMARAATPVTATTVYREWSLERAHAYLRHITATSAELRKIRQVCLDMGHPNLAPRPTLIQFHGEVYALVHDWISQEESGTPLTDAQRRTYAIAVESLEGSRDYYLDMVTAHLASSTPYVAPHEASAGELIAKGIHVFTDALRDSQAASRANTVRVRITP